MEGYHGRTPSTALSRGEGISLGFERCGSRPGPDVFETICSFANRQGGSLLLGVLDDGAVEGAPEPSALPIERNLVSVTCNPKLFNVAPAMECERLPCGDDRVVIRVWVPMGPSSTRTRASRTTAGTTRRHRARALAA